MSNFIVSAVVNEMFMFPAPQFKQSQNESVGLHCGDAVTRFIYAAFLSPSPRKLSASIPTQASHVSTKVATSPRHYASQN